jgi:hypothetical protein
MTFVGTAPIPVVMVTSGSRTPTGERGTLTLPEPYLILLVLFGASCFAVGLMTGFDASRAPKGIHAHDWEHDDVSYP